MNLRFYQLADGKMILQHRIVHGWDKEKRCNTIEEWQDVPVHKDACDNGLKKDIKPREFCVFTDMAHGGISLSSSNNKNTPIIVTEIPKGSRVISREELAKAWDKAVDGTIIPRSTFPDNDKVFKPYFKYFLKALEFDNE